jgi:hypothetical protein
MTTTKLTQANVSKLPKPQGNQVVYWDAIVKNFGLVVTKNNHRSYCIRYRVQGVSKRMHLKDCETLADARQQARAPLGSVSRGKALGQIYDPLEDRRSRERRKSTKFADIAKEWMSKKGSEFIVAAEWQAVLNNNISPTLGDMLINSVKRSVIINLLEKLAEEKGKSAASEAYKIIKAIMDWHSVPIAYCQGNVESCGRKPEAFPER